MSDTPNPRPARRRYTLEDLLVGMTPEALREAFDWGPDLGREAVEVEPACEQDSSNKG